MVKKLKTGIIVQARESSIRFPKKVLYSIIKKPLIIKILERLKKSKLKDVIVVSIPKNKKNSGLESLLINKKYKSFVYRTFINRENNNISEVRGVCSLAN